MSNIVLGFAFGHRGEYGPGLTNWSMARQIKLRFPNTIDYIAVQHEIGRALKGLGMKPHLEVKENSLNPKKYLDTAEVARQMKTFCDMFDSRHTKIYVVAHQDHMKRVLRVLNNIGIKAIPVEYEFPYDEHSHQIWTRSKRWFKLREWLAWPMYKYMGQA